MPIFWLAGILLVIVTSIDPYWPTSFRLPTRTVGFDGATGFLLLDTLLQRRFDIFADALRHLVLPAVALGTIPMAIRHFTVRWCEWHSPSRSDTC